MATLTYTPKQLGQAVLGTALATVFTAAAKVIVKEILLCNITNNQVTVDIAFLASGETIGNKNYAFSQLQILPKETKIISLSTVVELSGFMQAVCNASASVSVTVSGTEAA